MTATIHLRRRITFTMRLTLDQCEGRVIVRNFIQTSKIITRPDVFHLFEERAATFDQKKRALITIPSDVLRGMDLLRLDQLIKE